MKYLVASGAGLQSAIVINGHALVQSFCIVGVAEIFDKTWFVALVMAMMFNKFVVFWAGTLALLLHTLIAAIFGYGISKFFAISTLHFAAAALYAVLSVLYGMEWWSSDSDSDVLSAGKEEVTKEFLEEEGGIEGYGAAERGQRKVAKRRALSSVFAQVFTAVFVAEWGDRTQIAMIGQHASQPLIPVILGSAAAFALLTLSAVLLGVVLGERTLSERTICCVTTVSFAAFSVLAVWDGLAAHKSEAAHAHVLVL